MPRQNGKVPAYRLHKPSGQARAIVGGKHIYLGRHSSPASREKYARIIAELSASSPTTAGESPACAQPGLSVNELPLRHIAFARSYYDRNGVVTKEYSGLKEALLPVRQLFGLTRARDFGPKAAKDRAAAIHRQRNLQEPDQPSDQPDQLARFQVGGGGRIDFGVSCTTACNRFRGCGTVALQLGKQSQSSQFWTFTLRAFCHSCLRTWRP